MATPAPKTLYLLVDACPCCGRRVRASVMLRFWQAQPKPSHEKAEFMVTRSEGRGRISNHRSPFWPGLKAQDFHKSYDVRHALGGFFRALESRLREAAYVAHEAALRAERGG